MPDRRCIETHKQLSCVRIASWLASSIFLSLWAFLLVGCRPTGSSVTRSENTRIPTGIVQNDRLTPALRVTPSPHDTTAASTAETGSPNDRGTLGYLVVSAKEFGSIRAYDLAGGDFVSYATIEWAEGQHTELNTLVNETGWLALRAQYGYLHIYQLPEEDKYAEIWLLNTDLFQPPYNSDSFPAEQYFAVLGQWAAPLWSPNSPVVAFVGAIEDGWVNLYLYDTETGEMRRPFTIAENFVPLGWSPDGRTIALVSANEFTRHNYKPEALYFVSLDSTHPVVTIPIEAQHPLQIVDWVSNDQVMIAEKVSDRIFRNMTIVDLANSTSRVIFNREFHDAAVSRKFQRVLISENRKSSENSIVILDLMKEPQNQPLEIGLGGEIGSVRWIEALSSFGVENIEGSVLITPLGAIERHFPEPCLPTLSKDGNWLAFGPCESFYDSDLSVYSSEGELLIESEYRARDVEWWPDSAGLIFAMSPGGSGRLDIRTGEVSQVLYGAVWESSLFATDSVTFDRITKVLTPIPTPEPYNTPVGEVQTPRSLPTSDPKLRRGSEIIINELQMQDERTGWALGGSEGDLFERVLYTSSGGDNWREVTPPKDPAPSEEFLRKRMYGETQQASLFALDSQTAWVTYSAPQSLRSVVIWHTEDAGRTWSASEPIDVFSLEEYGPWVSGYVPIGIHFVDRQHGWLLAITEVPGLMMAADTILLRTDDGGQHWDFILGSSTTGPKGFVFLDRFDGWMLNTSAQPDLSSIIRTNDGGDYWYGEPGLPVDFSPQELLEERDCWAAYELEALPDEAVKMIIWCRNDEYSENELVRKSKNLLYISTDHGRSWRTQVLPVETQPEVSFSTDFLTDQAGWLLDYEAGTLLQTTNGGESWNLIKQLAWEGELHFIDHSHGWAIAWQRGHHSDERELSLVRTLDGGRTWELLEPAIE